MIVQVLRLLFALSTILVASKYSPSWAQSDEDQCKPPIQVDRSLVVTDAALDRQGFSFESTIDAILSSLGITANAQNRENFVGTLVKSFNAQQLNNPDSGLPMRVDVRRLEADLDPKKLLDPSDPSGLRLRAEHGLHVGRCLELAG